MKYLLITQSLLSCFVLLVLGEYVYLQRPNERVNRVFGGFCLLLTYWTFTEFMYRAAPDLATSYAWARAHVAASAFICAAWLHFSLAFAESKLLDRKLTYALLYGPNIIIAFIFSFLVLGPPVVLPIWGVVYTILAPTRLLYFLTVTWVMAPAYAGTALTFLIARAATDPLNREQARLVTASFAPPLVLALATAWLLQGILGITSPFLGTFTFPFMIMVIAYALARYQLFVVSPELAADNIISTMGDSLVLVDPSGLVVTANAATCDLLGRAERELVGHPAEQLFADPDFATRLLANALQPDGAYHNVETSYRTHNGETIPVLFSSSVVRDKADRVAGIVGIAKDIAERKAAEQALRRASEELEVRVQERTAELRKANEDLLAGIRARHLMQEQLREKDLAIRKAYIDVIGAVTGGRLILMTPEELRASLGAPITDAESITSYKEMSAIRHKITATIRARCPDFRDPDEYILAVGEALTNAVKHADAGTFRLYRTATAVQIEVADEGPGIDFDTLPKATLVPGFSTKRTMGLGFSIMLELCDRVLLSTEPGLTEVVLEMQQCGSSGSGDAAREEQPSP